MASQQPIGGGKIEAMSNLTYDLINELSDCGRAVDALDTYIEDAKRENNREVSQLFEEIRRDEIRHCDQLRQLIGKKVNEGKL